MSNIVATAVRLLASAKNLPCGAEPNPIDRRAARESKRLELLKEAVPKVARGAVLYDAASPGIVLDVKEVLQLRARGLGLTVQPRQD